MLLVFLSLDCSGKPYESITDVSYALNALFFRPLLLLYHRPLDPVVPLTRRRWKSLSLNA